MAEIVFENRHVLLPDHNKEFLRIVLCKITEAEPKHKKRTRYCSLEAFLNPMPENLEHEHVIPVKTMRETLLSGSIEQVDLILRTALACTVTKEEHYKKLGKVARSISGWERYHEAHIPVVDVKATQENSGNIVYFIKPTDF